MKLRFVTEKETKGAVRYQEVTDAGHPVPKDEAAIGMVYVRKSAFTAGMPKEFTMVITEGID
jgi:hypothetical protein